MLAWHLFILSMWSLSSHLNSARHSVVCVVSLNHYARYPNTHTTPYLIVTKWKITNRVLLLLFNIISTEVVVCWLTAQIWISPWEGVFLLFALWRLVRCSCAVCDDSCGWQCKKKKIARDYCRKTRTSSSSHWSARSAPTTQHEPRQKKIGTCGRIHAWFPYA